MSVSGQSKSTILGHYLASTHAPIFPREENLHDSKCVL